MDYIKLSRQQHKKQVPEWVLKMAPKLYIKASDIYGYSLRRDNRVPPIRFSYNARFDKFEWGNMRYFGGAPYIRLVKRKPFWSTYDMKTVGLTANSIPCKDKKVRMEFQMIHEFVHYFQHEMDRPMSEVETTQAEITFAETERPELYNQLEPIE